MNQKYDIYYDHLITIHQATAKNNLIMHDDDFVPPRRPPRHPLHRPPHTHPPPPSENRQLHQVDFSTALFGLDHWNRHGHSFERRQKETLGNPSQALSAAWIGPSFGAHQLLLSRWKSERFVRRVDVNSCDEIFGDVSSSRRGFKKRKCETSLATEKASLFHSQRAAAFSIVRRLALWKNTRTGCGHGNHTGDAPGN